MCKWEASKPGLISSFLDEAGSWWRRDIEALRWEEENLKENKDPRTKH